MTKRLFLKLLAFAGIGSAIPLPNSSADPARKYLTSCKCNELVGLHFHWNTDIDTVKIPNPSPGKDWVVCRWPLDRWIEYEGISISNMRNDKAFIRPVGMVGPLKLVCLLPVTRQDGSSDWTRFDLPPNSFYRE